MSPTSRPFVHVSLLGLTAAILASCSGSSDPAPETATLATPSPKVVTRTDVGKMLGVTDGSPVGITVTPDTGELVLLDANHGVYVLQEDRTFRLAMSNEDLHAQIDAFAFTDIAALGSNQFAITAPGDGFLLDLNAGTIVQHFCYVPGSWINVNLWTQTTNSVAFDTTTGRIVAQPVTIPINGWQPVDAQVGTFPITGGEGDDWHSIESSEFLADAISCDLNGLLWLVRNNELYTFDLDTDELHFEQSLDRFGTELIVGMAWVDGDLMLLDTAYEVICVPPSLLFR